MKSIKSSIFALLMMPLILLSSGGLNIFRHYCHSDKHIFYSITGFPTCPEDEYCSHCGHNECDKSLAVENGCENSHTYIYTITDLSVSDYLKILPTEAPELLLLFKPLLIQPTPYIINEAFLYTDFKSPPTFVPKYIPVLHKQLLIDFT